MKVDFQLIKEDLNQYGEWYATELFQEINGSFVKLAQIRIEELEFNALKKNFLSPPVLSGQFKQNERYS